MATVSKPEKDDSVRAIARGLAVLQAINRSGSMSMMQICREADIPYPTAFRIVETLIKEGMVEREPARKRYRATALVRTLSVGFQDEDGLVAVARPHIVALCKKHGWPISVATRVGHSMMVRDSTHKLTSLTFVNYSPGYTLPIVECSTGKAYLAFCEPEERDSIIRGLSQLTGPAEQLSRLLLQDNTMIDDIRRRGYATQARNAYTAVPGKTSSISVPLFNNGKVAGSIALIFFAAAMPLARAVEMFVDDLKATANAISAELAVEQLST
ncbi:MAG: helix-turn-helix domain-containing protein [Sphingomonadaceae bacterium]|nr:helix-turn-helix domain-containing protein [Sphingomonadaceae bacterium]